MHKITSWFDNLPLKRKGAGGSGSRHATVTGSLASASKRNRGGAKKNKSNENNNEGFKWYRQQPLSATTDRMDTAATVTRVANTSRSAINGTFVGWSASDYSEDRLVVTTASQQHQYYERRVERSLCVSNKHGELMVRSTPVTSTTNAAYSCFDQEELPVIVSSCTLPPPSSSNASRPKIRTNPWFTPTRSFRDVCRRRQSTSPRSRPADEGFASLQRHTYTRPPHQAPQSRPTGSSNSNVTAPKPSASLEESLCSSGYGSQHDSSPESSVHTPEWQASSSSTHTGAGFVATPEETKCLEDGEDGEDCADSVYDECLEVSSDDDDCAVCQTTAKRAPPLLHIPPPPPVDSRRNSAVLRELGGRLVVLKQWSARLRLATVEARTERERRLKERQLGLEQIHSLRNLKWNVRRNFELVL